MSERSLPIWKLLVGFTLFSLIAGGFKLFPMNKRYQQILVKSSSLKFGTDKALEDVIEYLEKRLEERSYYQFVMEKQPMRLTNVLTLADGSGPGSRRSRWQCHQRFWEFCQHSPRVPRIISVARGTPSLQS